MSFLWPAGAATHAREELIGDGLAEHGLREHSVEVA